MISGNLKDGIAYVVTAIHQALFDVSGGKVMGSVVGMPVVKLATKGRKSGKPRTTMLTVPVPRGDEVVLVASWGGDDRHPQWYKNILADPDVEVTADGRTRKMRARTATAEEKAELWPKITAAYSGYAGYQKRTTRDIPVVILSPR
jgi:deazaflavin-dependent oxidoreductase (nitroreductase family)